MRGTGRYQDQMRYSRALLCVGIAALIVVLLIIFWPCSANGDEGKPEACRIVGVAFATVPVESDGYRLEDPFRVVLSLDGEPDIATANARLTWRAPASFAKPVFPPDKAGQEESASWPCMGVSISYTSQRSEGEGLWKLIAESAEAGWTARKLQLFALCVEYSLANNLGFSAELTVGAHEAPDVNLVVVPRE